MLEWWNTYLWLCPSQIMSRRDSKGRPGLFLGFKKDSEGCQTGNRETGVEEVDIRSRVVG